jgi:hypothetical protein
MHNHPQSDNATNATPDDTASSATQTSRAAALPNQDGVEIPSPVESRDTAERQDRGGYVRLDERGMVLGFVPVREASDRQTSADIGSERSQ